MSDGLLCQCPNCGRMHRDLGFGRTPAVDEGDASAPADDAEVMRIWRECGLPEYFLGNGGSNHRLVAFAKACAALSQSRTPAT